MGDRAGLAPKRIIESPIHGWGRAGIALTGAGVAAVLAMTVLVVVLGLIGQDDSARFVSLLVSGSFAVLSAGVLLLWTERPVRSHPTRVLLCIAIICWGAGELMLTASARDGSLGYPAPGDTVETFAAPVCLLAVILAPRRVMSRFAGLRLGLDALAAAIAITFALWRITGGRIAGPDAGGQAETLITVLAEFTVLGMVVLAAIHDVRSRLWVGALGVLAQTVADMLIILSVQPGGERLVPWPAGVLGCVAWPLISLGVALYRPKRTESDDVQERRDASAATLATVTMTAALIGGVFFGHPHLGNLGVIATGTMIVILVLVPILCLRDLLGTRLRLELTSGLREQASRDGLTGLLNRWALTRGIADLDHSGAWVVLTLNLDGFKHINDLLGPAAGDDVLIAVADALREEASTHEGSPAGEMLAARIGGDEFAVLAPGSLLDGRRLAQVLQARVGLVLAQEAPGLDTGLSFGVGRLVRRSDAALTSGDRLSALVESAAALRAAKLQGRDRIEVYAGEVALAHERRIRVESRLKYAIRSGAVRTFAQPVVRLETGEVTGFEALARWTDDELGEVSPVEFIEVAEQTGMVIELGEQLLRASMEDAARAGVFAAGMSVAINASPIQLRVPGFVDAVRGQLAQHGVHPDQVIIEVTEAILVADDDPAVRALGELSMLGVGVAIDDFGTGYSALGYLRRLPVRVLKIDRSLTISLLDEAKTVAIVEGVVRMAHRMGIRVVMEGIESELQADSCQAIGADSGQGWLFGKAMPWPQAAALVRALTNPPGDHASSERPRSELA